VAYGADQLFGVSGLAVWGNNISGVTNVPVGLTNTTAIAAESADGLALSASGTVTAWGDDTVGQTQVPANLTNVVAIAAGDGSFALALQGNGTVTGWGDNSSGQTTIPAGLGNVVAIAAGVTHGLALVNNGTVIAWGANGYGQTSVPAGLSNVVAIAAGVTHSLALLNNGAVVAWGGGETNSGIYPNYGQSVVPPGLTNVVAISAYGYFSSALLNNGTVVTWGENNFGQTTVPGGLTNVVAISDGLYHMLALYNTGTAIGWGNNTYGESTVPAALTNIFAIAGGNDFSMALESPLSINLSVTPLSNGSPQTNSIAADSTVYYSVSVPLNAVAATNLLGFATAPLNIWFNQATLPLPANPPDTLLLGGVVSGASDVLVTNGLPPLLPGQTYYLAIQNTNNMTVNYIFGVNFRLVAVVSPPTNAVVISGIVHTNIGGTNGFLITWFAPSNDVFQVQETPTLEPAVWQTFTNIITYAALTPTNGFFMFFDNGSQYPFGPARFYRLLLLTSGSSLVLASQPNFVAMVSQPFSVTNSATDSNPAATLNYTLADFPTPSTSPAINSTNGIINWTPGAGDSGAEFRFTTVVADNNLPPLSATNAFTVFVMPAPTVQRAAVTSTNVTLQWTASTNDLFQVEWTTNLNPNIVWTLFPQTIVSTTGMFNFTDTNSPRGDKFYRLLWLPLP
jgi:alpha-tubulin suppressor-like RCC1 family protein